MTAPPPLLAATIPYAWVPEVVMLPVEVTVMALAPLPRAKIPNAPLPAVVMPKAPVLLVMVTAPFEVKLMPSVPLAGAMDWVRLLTLSVVTGGTRKSALLAIPADWLPVQIAIAPTVVQAAGPASAGPPIANDSVPAATVLKSAARKCKPRGRANLAPGASISRARPAKPATATSPEAKDMIDFANGQP